MRHGYRTPELHKKMEELRIHHGFVMRQRYLPSRSWQIKDICHADVRQCAWEWGGVLEIKRTPKFYWNKEFMQIARDYEVTQRSTQGSE